jgi:hypothetical protein
VRFIVKLCHINPGAAVLQLARTAVAPRTSGENEENRH